MPAAATYPMSWLRIQFPTSKTGFTTVPRWEASSASLIRAIGNDEFI